MDVDKIDRLEELVSKFIEDDRQIIDTKISRLTAPGDNNCSTMLKVDIKLNNKENGKLEVLNTVAKVRPANNFMRFAFEFSFKYEVAFYDVVVPTLQEFQRTLGVAQVIDFFPKIYVSRRNLKDDSDIVDDNAVLLMENLTVSGYRNVDRLIGFDLETTKLILKDLAAFHAVPLGFKLLYPESFEKKIKLYLRKALMSPPPPPPSENGEKPQHPDEALIAVFEQFDEFLPFLPLLRKNLGPMEFGSEPNGLYSTIIHGDMWANNIMLKFKDGKPIKSKFVDFQMYIQNSLAKDLFFFLWTSVQQEILSDSIDDLIKFYYDHFIDNLRQLKCDIGPFTFSTFLREITAASKSEFAHTFHMMAIVVLAKKSVNFNHEDSPKRFCIKKEDLTPEAKQRALLMLQECKKRGWF